MSENYIVSIDQSTQGTKALLFDNVGRLLFREDLPHKQIVNDEGWVSHDLNEIYQNTIQAIKNLITNNSINKNNIVSIGISNQRETSAIWNKVTGEPLEYAVVWQCARAKDISERIKEKGCEEKVKRITGITLSPYFPASKFAWLLEHVEKEVAKEAIALGTIDTWLLYKLTKGKEYKTDYSNASRTQLLNLRTLKWDEEICEIFHIDPHMLAEICDSDSIFGYTDLEGYLEKEIPVTAILGDSHAALFGQGCLEKGKAKVTYGTGSSVMMNIGEQPIFSEKVVTSLAWRINGKVNYVLEGNINYTGAVIRWLEKDLQLVKNAAETEELAKQANKEDTTYLVPAFTGLGAPYWISDAKALITGMSRTTGKAEIAKAALECIAYQIHDAVAIMIEDADIEMKELCVDGGPTRNRYLMQFQSDLTRLSIGVPDAEELSGIGVAYLAGIKAGVYDEKVFDIIRRENYSPVMPEKISIDKKQGWNKAIAMVKENTSGGK